MDDRYKFSISVVRSKSNGLNTLVNGQRLLELIKKETAVYKTYSVINTSRLKFKECTKIVLVNSHYKKSGMPILVSGKRDFQRVFLEIKKYMS